MCCFVACLEIPTPLCSKADRYQTAYLVHFHYLTYLCALFSFTIDDAGRNNIRFDAADKEESFDDAVKKIKSE